jgi:N-acetylneuraminic acid mutarotase
VVFLRPRDREPAVVVAGAWKAMPAAGLPARSEPAVVWTRKAMIVWGGSGDTDAQGDGASFDLASEKWTPLPPAPLVPRRGHTAVWSGTRMLIFGGLGGAGCEPDCALGDGAAYDPVANSWTSLAPAPLEPRSGHTAVWVQNRMIVWGGAAQGGGALGDGASYDLATDTWTTLPLSPLSPRVSHRTVATTHRMLVWGGSSEAQEGGQYFADGAIYSPASNSWVLMAAAPASVTPRDNFASVWTGEQMIVWGGYGRSETCAPCFRADGAAYDLTSDTWTPITPSPLSGRGGVRAVWTGRDMLVWGGYDSTEQGDGALYNPTTGSWARLVPGPVAPRQHHAMVWTGQQLLLWGGQGPSARLADGAVLTLAAA